MEVDMCKCQEQVRYCLCDQTGTTTTTGSLTVGNITFEPQAKPLWCPNVDAPEQVEADELVDTFGRVLIVAMKGTIVSKPDYVDVVEVDTIAAFVPFVAKGAEF